VRHGNYGQERVGKKMVSSHHPLKKTKVMCAPHKVLLLGVLFDLLDIGRHEGSALPGKCFMKKSDHYVYIPVEFNDLESDSKFPAPFG